MLVLGIDCGGEATGYGLIASDGRRHRIVTSGTIRLPRSHAAGEAAGSFAARLHTIHTALSALIVEHRPECVAVEDVFFAKNVRTALRLSHVRGVAMQAAASFGLVVAEYSPREIKCALTGYGNAEKSQVQHMVRSLLALDDATTIDSADASDALAVAICHLHSTPQDK